MAIASNNAFPSVLVTEGTVPSTPGAGTQRLYIDSTTHLLKLVNSSGTASNVSTGLTNPMTTTGDTIYSSDGSGTPARLAGGTAGKFLTAAGAAAPAWGQGPLTTTGDLLIGATGGTPTRLAAVATGSVLNSAGTGTAPAWGYPTLTVGDAAVGADVAIGGSVYVDVVSLALGAGTWDVYAWANVTNASAAAVSSIFAAITTNANTQLAQVGAALPISGQNVPTVLAPSVAGSQTIKLRVYATQTGAAQGTTSIGTGGGSKIHAIRIA